MPSNFYFKEKLPERHGSPAGSKFAKTYHMEIDGHGHKELIEDGYTDLYERIQSHLEESKIENIIARAQMGDLSGLMARSPQFMDLTDMPQTLAEAQNLIIRLTQEFETLPLEIRKQFNHSAEEYIAKYGNEEWINYMGIKKEETTTPAETNTQPEPEAETNTGE